MLCWSYAKASSVATLPCPPNTGPPLNQLDASSALNAPVATTVATKACLSNGRWYVNSENIWQSNYSLCELSDEFTDRRYLVDLGLGIFRSRDYKNIESLLNVRIEFLKDRFPFSFNRRLKLNFRQRWLPIVRIVSQIGYSTSFAMLIVAMIVFSLLRYAFFLFFVSS